MLVTYWDQLTHRYVTEDLTVTHREARRKTGSRTQRRMGVRNRRTRTGTMRKGTKETVALRVRRVLQKAAQEQAK